jgi:hypothetical protein
MKCLVLCVLYLALSMASDANIRPEGVSQSGWQVCSISKKVAGNV